MATPPPIGGASPPPTPDAPDASPQRRGTLTGETVGDMGPLGAAQPSAAGGEAGEGGILATSD